jgi:hypothetical protein
MAKDRPPTYTPAPQLPTDPELRRRFDEIVAVLAETQTVSGAASSLGLSRNRFQTILHRTIAAMLEEITPKPAGRPARPEREVALEKENQELREQLETLRAHTEMIERMMKIVGGIASGRTPLPRSRSKKTKPEDPEPAPIRNPTVVSTMRESGAPTKLCAEVLGLSPATIRRDRVRGQSGTPRSRRRAVDTQACTRVRSIVRATHGAVGAGNLSRMSGVPRRMCAELKRAELRDLERERKERCARITITAPGILRGFDAMHVKAGDLKAYWLVAADAAVPYRTSIATVLTYDALTVIAALRADFELHGPPLVLRWDRIACQRTPEVYELLQAFDVLPLHGPPRYPRYYGQLERQNREHRDWYNLLVADTTHELAAAGEDMRTALNGMWPRPSLNGWTAEQAWRAYKPPSVDRRELRLDVDQRTQELVTRRYDWLYARRIAIETALTERGLLSINHGGWC